jgi:hypothetical protein
VSYAAEAAINRRGRPTVYRQFAYVLAPARTWAGFGGLDVVVHLPEGWHAACTPPLRRQGDTLTGSFSDLPADALALTLQAPAGWAYQPLVSASLGLLILVGVGGPVFCWWAGRAKGRSLARSTPGGRPGWLRRLAWPRSLGVGVLWGGAILASGVFAISGPDLALPAGQVSIYGYGRIIAAFGVVCFGLLAVPVGFVIAQVTAVVVRARAGSGTEPFRRSRREPVAELTRFPYRRR